MPLLFSFLSLGLGDRGPYIASALSSQDKPVHEDYMEERSKCFMHVSLRDISMLNNSPWHPKISIEVVCYAHLSKISWSLGTVALVRVCLCVRETTMNKREGHLLAGPLGSKSPFI